ncbi:hypothetical protein U1Q18_040718 [Sarracenia purpurea var. burkii]
MGIKVVSEMVDRVLEIRCKFYMGQSQDQEQRRSRPDRADLRGGSEKSVSEKEVVSNQELQISENVDVTLPVEESLAAGITGDTIKTPDKLPVFVAEQSSADQDLPPSPFYEDLSEGISGKEEDLHIFSPPDTRSSKSKRKKKRSNSKFFSW